ncbi:unnamed protein product [Pieris brassicae]|uniref:Autophagy-related protein 13 n=1 Tax=Pieris brassicae TaxID=7116 RepID=A0A9P0U169_PIEBR|nr:unnamed protein product [Pieris brassicae]
MSSADAQDRLKLYKFTKILTLKIAQIVVQSRQGRKIVHLYNTTKSSDDNVICDTTCIPNNLQWFNLSIPDVPDVNNDTKRVLNGEVIQALSNVLCIEISLHTNDGDDMVLEFWTVKIGPLHDATITSISTIYYRMSIMLKSTLSISRITPAYKMSRLQNKDCYKISHKIYGGQPNLDLLGKKYKNIKVGELHMPIGTIEIEVSYRTEMTILPEPRSRVPSYGEVQNISNSDIMVKSDHFPKEIPRKNYSDKKKVDLTKPLTAGAFVDTIKLKELHDALYQQLPPAPPMEWLLAEKDKMEKKIKLSMADAISKPGPSSEAEPPLPLDASKAVEVPKCKDSKYASLMDFPFADGSPITELANFYQECLQARSASEAWTNESISTDSENLSQQLKMYEEAVPEFDSMVESMFSNTEYGSDHT